MEAELSARPGAAAFRPAVGRRCAPGAPAGLAAARRRRYSAGLHHALPDVNEDRPEPSPHALPPGTRVGEYELRRVLADGGFGIVYLAFDHALEREVAVKEFFPASLAVRGADDTGVVVRSQADAELFALALRSFINEARLLARFDHPSLLKVHRFWQANGTAYMAMPVYHGPTIKEVRRSMAEPPDEAWLRPLLSRLLGALATMHDASIYHRDIAPDNIVLEADGRPVLLDFGAARRVISDKNQTLTAILKPSYAPIEQYAEAASVRQGPWTDLYALGATMHFMLLGRPPEPATARAVHDDQQPLAGQVLPGCSADFLRLVDWMLAPAPKDRPQSVAVVQAALGGDTPGAVAALAPPALRPAAPAPPRVAAPARTGGLWSRLAGLFTAPAPAPATRPPPPPPAADRGETTVIGASPARAAASVAAADRTVMLTGSAPPAGAQAMLTVVRSDVPSFIGRRFALGDELRIGRDAGDLSLPDPQWSRQHALVRRTEQGFEVSDLGSSNGTFVNGFQIAARRPYPLHPGASLRVGSTLFVLGIESDESLAHLAGTEVAGRYRLQACLQSSPKGALYRAEKSGSGVRVAIKLLSPAYAAYAGYRQRFETEARVAASLQHPHVCRLDDYGEAELALGGRIARVPFLSYPIMGGGSLAERSPRSPASTRR